MSYRYIGRQFSSMNAVDDDTVTLRHDMRNAAGGILSQIFSISAPGGGGPSDLEVVPNPVIHSVQILDNGNDVKRIEVIDAMRSRSARGSTSAGRRSSTPTTTRASLALIEGQGASIGDVPDHIKGDQLFDDDPIEHVEDSPDLPAIWQVFGGASAPTATGASGSCRPSSRHPMQRSTSVRSSSSTRPPPSISPAHSPTPINCSRSRTTSCSSRRGKVGPFRIDGKAARGAFSTLPARPR